MSEPHRKPAKMPRDKQLQIRIDAELHDAALTRAQGVGWTLGAVVRAMLRAWVEGNTEGPTALEVGRESVPADKRPRKTKGKRRSS